MGRLVYYTYIHEWLIFMVNNVGRYTYRYMDAMGFAFEKLMIFAVPSPSSVVLA